LATVGGASRRFPKAQSMVTFSTRSPWSTSANLTRENVMKQAANMKDVQGDLSLPGTMINTSPTDYRVIKQLQMMRFKGERWELFGPIITDDYGG
jgi:hypothetical protein